MNTPNDQACQCAGCGAPVSEETRLFCKRCEDEASSISTKDFYLRMIARPEVDTRFLNSIREDVKADDTLHGPEKDELFASINQRQAALNAGVETPAQQVAQHAAGYKRKTLPERKVRGCKHLIILLLTLSLALTFRSFASAPVTPVQTGANDQSAGSLTVRRLIALSMIESGDNDNAIGRAGEVSRFQILPAVWRAYASGPRSIQHVHCAAFDRPVILDPRNCFTAWNIAKFIMHDRCNAFETRFHRPPTDLEFYILWARPAWYFSRPRLHPDLMLVLQRATRFESLVNR